MPRFAMLAALIVVISAASDVRPTASTLSVESNAGTNSAVVFVGSSRPRFGWVLEGDPAAPESRGRRRQTAFRINATILLTNSSDAGPAWDSGWVLSSSSVGVPWGGANLSAGNRVRWSLQVKDGAGAKGSVVDGPRCMPTPPPLPPPLQPPWPPWSPWPHPCAAVVASPGLPWPSARVLPGSHCRRRPHPHRYLHRHPPIRPFRPTGSSRSIARALDR